MKWLKRCKAGNHYTFLEECHGKATGNPHPAKFDVLQKYSEYRRG